MEGTVIDTRSLINLRGFCLYCLGRIERCHGGTALLASPSPAGPGPGGAVLSSPCTPLKHRFVHSLPLEERLAPFADLCRYLEIDLPDNYAFEDDMESESLTPPLCQKCNELSTRLCMLQEELQFIKTRINNTVRRIFKRVSSTCSDEGRGALKREIFHKEFRNKSRGLSRRRDCTPVTKKDQKTLDLVQNFHQKVLEKDSLLQSDKTQPYQCFSVRLFEDNATCIEKLENQTLKRIRSPLKLKSPVTPTKLEEETKKDIGLETEVAVEVDEADLAIEDNDFKDDNDHECDLEENLNEASILNENFLPSQTLHWPTDNTLLERTIITGVKRKDDGTMPDLVNSSRLVLSVETGQQKVKPKCSENDPVFSKTPVPISSNDNQEQKRTPITIMPNRKTDIYKTPELRGRDLLLGRIDSSKITNNRTHRMRARRCLKLPPKRIRVKDDDNDEEDKILSPFT